jgi:hypothetical protein
MMIIIQISKRNAGGKGSLTRAQSVSLCTAIRRRGVNGTFFA